MSNGVSLVLALLAAYGVFLLYTATLLGWRGVGVAPATQPRRRRRGVGDRLAGAGLGDVRVVELAATAGVFFIVAAGAAYGVFGGSLAPAAAGVVAATAPVAGARTRQRQRRAAARQSWPRMIEEIRLLVASVGRSVPQALFEVGARGPAEMRPAFAAAHREWLLSTDFARTLATLQSSLADATADAVCETLLIAHEMGGSDIDARLAALVEDRTQDMEGRKDAAAKQAGARFARAFVVIAPAGMALVGLTIGDGRAAYAAPAGQLTVVSGIAVIVGCWMWAGRLLRLPDQQRVFVPLQPGSPR